MLLDELRPAPTLLVIEDVHWADEATLDLVALLGPPHRPTRGLVVVTCRDDELALDHPLRSVPRRPGRGRRRTDPAGAAVARRGARARRAARRRRRAVPRRPAATRSSSPRCWPPAARAAAVGARRRAGPRRRGSTPRPARCSRRCRWSPGRCRPSCVAELGRRRADRLGACLASGMLVETGDGIAFRHDLARVAIADGIDPLRRSHSTASRSGCCAGVRADAARLAHHAEEAGDADAVEQFAPRGRCDGGRPRRPPRGGGPVPAGVAPSGASSARPAGRPARAAAPTSWYLIDRFDEAIAWLEDAIELRHETATSSARRRVAPAVERPALRRPPADAAATAPLRRRAARRPAAGASWPPPTPTWRCSPSTQRPRRRVAGGRSGARAVDATATATSSCTR